MPIFLVRGVAEALAEMKGPVILIANLLTEGRGMVGFTAADAVARIEEAIQPAGRRRHHEHEVAVAAGARPLRARAQGAAGAWATLPAHCELVGGEFWTGEIARHDRLRLAYAVWSVLSRRLLRELRRRSTAARDHAGREHASLLDVCASRCAFVAVAPLCVFVRLARLRASRRCVSLARAGLELRGALDDRREHRAGLAALGRTVRCARSPACPRARMSSKSPSLFTLRGANSAMSTSPAHSSRCLISSQLPIAAAARAGVAAAGPHQHPRSFQLVAVQRELQVALLQRRIHVVDFRRPRAAVPEHHDAGAVAFRDDAFELAVVERMILDVHREPLGLRIERRALRHRPRQQHAVVLEPEVVVQVAGEVLLDAEERARARFGARRFACGSGVFVKSRLRLYSSRAMASVRQFDVAHQSFDRAASAQDSIRRRRRCRTRRRRRTGSAAASTRRTTRAGRR